MQLRDIQQQFIQATYGAHVPANRFVRPSSQLTAEERLAIYRGSVRGGLLNALGDIYPVVKKLMGDRPFDGICRKYIEATPSTSANLADYGDHFGDFIQQFKPLASYPYFADTARLEWHWHQVFHESDDASLDLALLSHLTPEQQLKLRFKKPNASRLFRSCFPVHQIWIANQEDARQDERVELIEGDYPLLIWRQQYNMRIDCLTPSQWEFLNQLSVSPDFEAAIDQFLTIFPDENVSELFVSAVSSGWITEFEST